MLWTFWSKRNWQQSNRLLAARLAPQTVLSGRFQLARLSVISPSQVAGAVS